MKKRAITSIFLITLLLNGCSKQVNHDFVEESKYLLASTDQFGDNSELIGITEKGDKCYDQKLQFGGITNIEVSDDSIKIFTPDKIHYLKNGENEIKSEQIDSKDSGKVYQNSITNYQSNHIFVYNQGFGDKYYKNTIFKNSIPFVNIEGATMCYGYRNNSISVVYTHTASMAEEKSDFKIDSFDLDSGNLISSIDLPMLNDYTFISGELVGDIYYLYGYSGHDVKNVKSTFVKVNLKDKSIEIIKTIDLKDLLVLNAYHIDHKIYFILEYGNYIVWDLNDNDIQKHKLIDSESEYTSFYKLSKNSELYRLGYDKENLYIYKYDLPRNKIINKTKINYESKYTITDFIVLEK